MKGGLRKRLISFPYQAKFPSKNKSVNISAESVGNCATNLLFGILQQFNSLNKSPSPKSPTSTWLSAVSLLS